MRPSGLQCRRPQPPQRNKARPRGDGPGGLKDQRLTLPALIQAVQAWSRTGVPLTTARTR
jgi:hypothetical protein